MKKGSRSAPPPAAENGGLPRRKTFFTFLICARHPTQWPRRSACASRQNPQNFHHFFLWRAQRFIFHKGRKFCGFCSALNARGGAASHPCAALRAASRRAKIHFPHTSFSFCPPAGMCGNCFGTLALAPHRPCAGKSKVLP